MVVTLLVEMRWRKDRLQRPKASAGPTTSADAEMNSLISEGGGEKTGALTQSSYRLSVSAEKWLMIHK